MMDMPGREATATTPRLGVSTTAIALWAKWRSRIRKGASTTVPTMPGSGCGGWSAGNESAHRSRRGGER